MQDWVSLNRVARKWGRRETTKSILLQNGLLNRDHRGHYQVKLADLAKVPLFKKPKRVDPPDPSPEQIAYRCRQIQKGWTEKERNHRRVTKIRALEVMQSDLACNLPSVYYPEALR